MRSHLSLRPARHRTAHRPRYGPAMNQSQVDLKEFDAFEKNAHQRLAQTYYDSFSIVSDRAIEPLLEAAHVAAGTRLLDVAPGPGTLASMAAGRGAVVIAVDVAPAMIALASS